MKNKILIFVTLIVIVIAICVVVFIPKNTTNTTAKSEAKNKVEGNVVNNAENKAEGKIVKNAENKAEGKIVNNAENKAENNVVNNAQNKEENKVTNNVSATSSSSSKSNVESTNGNDNLEIKLEDLSTSKATFIKYESNGVEMELVAIKDSKDDIDVAFNTCQVCNGSPNAYFVQKSGKLVCQNCGNKFALSSIGASSDGCNPITIADSNVTKTDTGITISKEYLSQNENLFTNVISH